MYELNSISRFLIIRDWETKNTILRKIDPVHTGESNLKIWQIHTTNRVCEYQARTKMSACLAVKSDSVSDCTNLTTFSTVWNGSQDAAQTARLTENFASKSEWNFPDNHVARNASHAVRWIRGIPWRGNGSAAQLTSSAHVKFGVNWRVPAVSFGSYVACRCCVCLSLSLCFEAVEGCFFSTFRAWCSLLLHGVWKQVRWVKASQSVFSKNKPQNLVKAWWG